jgi:carbamoyltransferase
MAKKILLLTHELADWYYASRFTYEANFGIEEGLESAGVDYTTVPIFLNHRGNVWYRWQKHVMEALRDREFDQVWFEASHASYSDAFMNWLADLSPVRVGMQLEGIEPHPEEYVHNRTGTEFRVKNARRNRELATHIIVVDESDISRVMETEQKPAFWWCGTAIPERFLADYPRPHTSEKALFFGTLYGRRQRFLEDPVLRGLIAIGRSNEDRSGLPAKYSQLILYLQNLLKNGTPLEPTTLFQFINGIRKIRKATFPLWLDSLARGCAVINLPQFASAYASRVKQGMAVGRPVISWRIPDRPLTGKMFEDGKEILLYDPDSPEELARHIRRIQSDAVYSNWIAGNALAKMRKYHTVERFVRNVLAWVEYGYEPDYGIPAGDGRKGCDKQGSEVPSAIKVEVVAEQESQAAGAATSPGSKPGNRPPQKVAAYLHIPKTGGTYLAQLENGSQPVIAPMNYLGHTYIVENPDTLNPIDNVPGRNMNRILTKESLNGYILFATVRNIYDWLVSYFFHAGGFNPLYRDPDHYDFASAHKGFDYLVKTIADREDLWPNRKFLFFQLFSDRGELLPRWINRTHTLDRDLRRFAEKYRLRYTRHAPQRQGRNEEEQDYRRYYTDSLVSLVNQTWGREIELYGFDFEQVENSHAVLDREVDPEIRKRIRYRLEDDVLVLDDAEGGAADHRRREDTFTVLARKEIWKETTPLRLHLGCGEQYLEGYVNIDYPPADHNVMDVKADYFADVTRLDFPPNSVDEIRLHHVFEHFPRVTALALLIRWHRWLKIGGLLYIETPDFVGSAKTLLADVPWKVKMGIIRHLTGDQTAFWGYHIEQWFPERFEKTLARLGFTNIQTQSTSWTKEPYLSNVHVVAKKKKHYSMASLIAAGESILWESTVSEAERPSYRIWCRQLREIVVNGGSVATPLRTFDRRRSNGRPTAETVDEGVVLFLGVKCYGHDSALFSVFPEGKDIFAMATERLTRFKHDTLFPIPVIKRLLEYKGIKPGAVRKVYVGSGFRCQQTETLPQAYYETVLAERRFYEARYVKEFERKRKEFLAQPPEERRRRISASDEGILFSRLAALTEPTTVQTHYRFQLRALFPNAAIEMRYYDHELCHAVSAYYSCPFEKAVVIAFDGYGDDNYFSRVYLVDRGEFKEIGSSRSKIRTLHFQSQEESVTHECSIGGIYSYFTYLLGFRPDSDEGKVEALAAFGKWDNPVYRDLKSLVEVSLDDGVVIDYDRATRLLDISRMRMLMGEIPKEDMAAAVQKFLEDVMLEYVGNFLRKTGVKALCLSGGVTANVVCNLRIFNELTDEIFIVPAMADDGAAQGAAILTMMDRGFGYEDLKWMKEQEMPYWGTSYTSEEVEKYVSRYEGEIAVEQVGKSWPGKAAEFIVNGEIGALFNGRMEWGPRALGNRSIIADVRNPDIQDIINKNVKNRPEFQPFCPSVLEEERERLFKKSYSNKHMTIAFDMKREYWDKIPGAIHVDGTARAQFVTEKDNPDYYRLIKRVKELTGFGVILNTSFNKHGRAIVENPDDAIRDFLDSNLDFLMMEGLLIRRRDQQDEG